jgi:transcriptional regulator with XRE-family HTH domain
MSPTKWSELKQSRSRTSAVREGYARARNAYRLAERVRVLREARGITQHELARRMRTTQSVIARLESGGRYPTLSTLERISDALGAELVVEFRDALRPRSDSVLASAATRVASITRGRQSVRGRATARAVRATGRRRSAAPARGMARRKR